MPRKIYLHSLSPFARVLFMYVRARFSCVYDAKKSSIYCKYHIFFVFLQPEIILYF